MIKKYSDYKRYITIEIVKSPIIAQRIKEIFCTTTNTYLKYLRKLEYHFNNKGIYHKIMSFYYFIKWHKVSTKLGIYIPKNVCKEGLTLYHYGSIVVNPNCKIGKNCCIQNNVNIGANIGEKTAPRIGDNVYIGPGAVIFGDIYIADNCYIGANACVTKSIETPYSVVVGAPARIIKIENKNWWTKENLNR